MTSHISMKKDRKKDGKERRKEGRKEGKNLTIWKEKHERIKAEIRKGGRIDGCV